MAHPSWYARIQTSGPGMKNGQHQPDFRVPLESLAIDRNPSSCGHWDGRSLCKSADSHPSSAPVPQHYTKHSGWGILHLNPTSLTSMCRLLPPTVEGSAWITLNGVLSVTLITCSVEWVQLSSQDSKEKVSWYSARSEWAESTSSGGQDPRLLKS